jgi:hypothetical protein
VRWLLLLLLVLPLLYRPFESRRPEGILRKGLPTPRGCLGVGAGVHCAHLHKLLSSSSQTARHARGPTGTAASLHDGLHLGLPFDRTSLVPAHRLLRRAAKRVSHPPLRVDGRQLRTHRSHEHLQLRTGGGHPYPDWRSHRRCAALVDPRLTHPLLVHPPQVHLL